MHYSRPETNTAQCTLNEPVHCTGIGLHDGQEASLTLLPAPPNSGTHFLRRDVDITRALIPASWRSIVETHPDTLLGNEYGIGVHGVETLLAALRGSGVDNVLIEINGYEVPNLDGSSAPLLQMINQAGVIAQGAARQIIWVEKIIAVRIGEHYACIMPGLLPSITIDDVIPGDSNAPQNLSINLLDHVFEREIAPARHPQHETTGDDRHKDSPPLVDANLKPGDAWGLTFWDRNHCRDQIAALNNQGLFTPISEQLTLMFPGSLGGANWGGGAWLPSCSRSVCISS